jgi:peptidoglycan/LPS O-acetylase OafA/YrhL
MKDPTASHCPMLAHRLPGLDLLRAAAISWVMIYHASLFNLVSQRSWVVRFGWMGVDLFFVLSGFLIAGQLLRPWARGQAPSLSRFFTRRLLRTLPAYLVVLALYFLVPVLRDHTDIQPLWRFLTFTQNVGLDPIPPKAFSHAWSLCVEEQFYHAFPIVVTLIARRPSATKIIGAVILVFVLGVALRGYLWLTDVAREPFNPTSEPRASQYMTLIYYPTWTRLDGLLAGIAAAAVQTFRPLWWRAILSRANCLVASGMAGIATAIILFHGQVAGFLATMFGFPLLALSMAMLVVAGSDNRSVIGRYAIPGAGALAAGAYSLYLSHKIIFHAIYVAEGAWPSAMHSLALSVALGAALAAGAALYWLVERPFLKLRDRLQGPPPGHRPVQPSISMVAELRAAGE